MADDAAELVLVLLEEFACAREGDLVDVFIDLFRGHADTVVDDFQRLGCLVEFDAHCESAELGLVFACSCERLHLLGSIHCIGYELPEEDFMIRIKELLDHREDVLIWGIIILACLIIAVIGIILFGYVREEGLVEFENNVEKVTFTEVVGEETYIITISSDGYFEGIGMSDEIKEELMELIVVGDLPTSEDNITDYFIKLREGTQQETP